MPPSDHPELTPVRIPGGDLSSLIFYAEVSINLSQGTLGLGLQGTNAEACFRLGLLVTVI